jgi:hypothetical protein
MKDILQQKSITFYEGIWVGRTSRTTRDSRHVQTCKNICKYRGVPSLLVKQVSLDSCLNTSGHRVQRCPAVGTEREELPRIREVSGNHAHGKSFGAENITLWAT